MLEITYRFRPALVLAAAVWVPAALLAQQPPSQPRVANAPNAGDGEVSASWSAAARGIETRGPALPDGVDRVRLAAYVDQLAWCGVPLAEPIDLALPVDLDERDAVQGLAHLIFAERSWSLAHVKRAIDLIALAQDETASGMLAAVMSEAAGIVAARATGMQAPERHDELAPFVADQVVDLRRTVVRAAARRTDPASAELVSSSLEDPSERVRRAAASALASAPQRSP